MGNLEKVLLVDDEGNLLSGLRRQLRGRYDLTTATSGPEALDCISTTGPYAVVVSDMRMPGMDGVELLGAVSDKAPQTVRMMLTGNADQETAVKAINDGHIFRFFNKPCDAATLSRGIDDAIQQHRLQIAEKELIEQTLAGSVMLLSDVLTMIHPTLARRRDNMRVWARKLAVELKVSRAWEIDLAAMLGRIGLIGVPLSLQDKLEDRAMLTPEDMEILESVPRLGHDLVSRIPRLENVAKGILYQDKNYNGTGLPEDEIAGDDIPFIARVLKVLNDLFSMTNGLPPGKLAFKHLSLHGDRYDPTVLAAVERILAAQEEKLGPTDDARIFERVPVKLLRSGLMLESDITYADGRLILSKGCELTEVQAQRVRAIHKVKAVAEPIVVSRGPIDAA